MARELVVTLPTLHSDQVRAYNELTQYTALRCGRRWGKSLLLQVLACDAVLKGLPVMYAAPDYKRTSEFFNAVTSILKPVTKSSSQTAGLIRAITGGSLETWTLQDESAGRSRMYGLVLLDEAAFTKNGAMLGIWEKAIRPTLFDLSGRCVVASNTNGVDDDNFLYQICHDDKYRFTQVHATTLDNPTIPKRLPAETIESWQARRQDELDKLKADNHPLVYQQEILAEFVDFRGVAFFSLDSLLVNSVPAPYPSLCDAVGAVLDTAVKTGSDNDGSAVIYFAINRKLPGHKLIILDYDLVQIEGSLLEAWLPSVFVRLEHLAKECKARAGSLGAWVEDKSSGEILLQQGRRHGWKVHPIDTTLTAKGKDERAVSVSGYVYRGDVKISQFAHDKVVTFKNSTRNHLLSQVCGFRLGDKDAAKRADDLLDCFTYSASITLGNSEGW